VSARVATLIGAFALAACGSTPPPAPAGAGALAGLPTWTYTPASMVFPADRPLDRPEDGVVLRDGTLLVADRAHGLRRVSVDGDARPFGRFVEAGYEHRADAPGGASGVALEPNGTHVLVADVLRGGIWRVDIAAGRAEKLYQHAFGVNAAIRDARGGLWFTQSTRNGPQEGEPGLGRAIATPMPDGVVFHVPAEAIGRAGAAVPVAAGLYFPNGLALDGAAGRLYVAETMRNRVVRFRVDATRGRAAAPETVLEIAMPDNVELDREGRLWVASPLRTEVVVLDTATGASRQVFRVATPASEALIVEAQRRMAAGRSPLDLFGPELWAGAPGIVTGVAIAPGDGPVYLTGLGGALIRLPR
jgi:sugar lactone lactonase YvrE